MLPTTGSAPPVPPRPLTRKVRRRAWADPLVRAWLVGALVLLAIALYLLISRYLSWRESARLIESGVPVDATVLEADEVPLKGHTVPGDSSVRLEYEYQGQRFEVRAPYLEGRASDQAIIVGSTVPIRIDPSRPWRWTPRTRATPLGEELIGGAIVLPIGLAFLAVAASMRGSLLRTWTRGTAIPALVVSARHSALAPRAWTVQCTPADEADKRLLSVFTGPRADVSEGAAMWLLMPSGRGRPRAASWFQ